MTLNDGDYDVYQTAAGYGLLLVGDMVWNLDS